MTKKISDKQVGTSEGCTCASTVADPMIRAGQKENSQTLKEAADKKNSCKCSPSKSHDDNKAEPQASDESN